MALTNCPHCGGKVSDTAEKCVHCGEILRRKSMPTQNAVAPDFLTLPAERQKRIKSEFLSVFPAQRELDKKFRINKLFLALSYVLSGLGLLFAMLFIWAFDDNITVIVLSIVMLIAAIILSIIVRVQNKVLKPKIASATKLFVLWLKECKNINLNIAVDGKMRVMYDSAVISESDKRQIADRRLNKE